MGNSGCTRGSWNAKGSTIRASKGQETSGIAFPRTLPSQSSTPRVDIHHLGWDMHRSCAGFIPGVHNRDPSAGSGHQSVTGKLLEGSTLQHLLTVSRVTQLSQWGKAKNQLVSFWFSFCSWWVLCHLLLNSPAFTADRIFFFLIVVVNPRAGPSWWLQQRLLEDFNVIFGITFPIVSGHRGDVSLPCPWAELQAEPTRETCS